MVDDNQAINIPVGISQPEYSMAVKSNYYLRLTLGLPSTTPAIIGTPWRNPLRGHWV